MIYIHKLSTFINIGSYTLIGIFKSKVADYNY